MHKNKTVIGVLLLLLAAVLYSSMPVMIRLLRSEGIPPVSQVFLRYIFAFLAAATYYFVIEKKQFAFPTKHLLLLSVTTIFGYALTNLFFTIGILNTQVSNALFLFYSYAIIAPILGFIFLKDKVNSANVISLIISLLALLLLFRPNSFTTWAIGGGFAILSSFGQASYLILRKKLQDYSAPYMMLANTFIGVLLLFLLSLILDHTFYFNGSIQYISRITWLTTILFGIGNFFAWLAMTKGFEYFKATASSVILLSELVFGVIFAFLFFKEIPATTTIIGGILIIISSVLVIYKGER